MQVHEITLMGKSFKIRSDQDPAYLAKVASYVDEKIEGITGGQKNVPPQNALLLTVLNVADELFQARQAHESLRADIRSQSKELLTQMGHGA